MNIFFSEKAKKAYKKLPPDLKKKTDKQFQYLRENPSHSSLRIKKMQGVERWEGRISKSYRFTFEKENDSCTIRTIGPHDEGLGKK